MVNCRICEAETKRFLSFGNMPLANNFLDKKTFAKISEGRMKELRYPLELFFCKNCGMVQIGEVVPPEELFITYIYLASNSKTMKTHISGLVKRIMDNYVPKDNGFVVEIGSNTGDLLKLLKTKGIRVLGVEPAKNIAAMSNENDVETIPVFFNKETAQAVKKDYGTADAVIGRHVFAHIHELDSVIKGARDLIGKDGVFIIEIPYLVDFIERNEFDTVYHEHLSYFSVRTLKFLFNKYDMDIVDVERALDIHGGSIIVYVKNKVSNAKGSDRVNGLIELERQKGLSDFKTYSDFADRVFKFKNDLLILLKDLKSQGKRICGYGAPAKSTTLLNYCGIGSDILDFVVDNTPTKQGLYLPGSHVPTYSDDYVLKEQPDYFLLLAWNFAKEIINKEREYIKRGGRFIVPIPSVHMVP